MAVNWTKGEEDFERNQSISFDINWHFSQFGKTIITKFWHFFYFVLKSTKTSWNMLVCRNSYPPKFYKFHNIFCEIFFVFLYKTKKKQRKKTKCFSKRFVWFYKSKDGLILRGVPSTKVQVFFVFFFDLFSILRSLENFFLFIILIFFTIISKLYDCT